MTSIQPVFAPSSGAPSASVATPLTTEPYPIALPRPDADAFAAVLTRGAYMRLTQFGVIDVSGVDAATFLHSQLTSDIQHLDTASARVSGYCSPKGRLLASFLVWRSDEATRLLVSQDVQAASAKRLSMFVLRAKARLTDISGSVAVIGLAGDVRQALAGVFEVVPERSYAKVDAPAGTLIRLPDAAGRERYLWLGPTALVEAHLAGEPAATVNASASAHATAALPWPLPEVSPVIWDWLEIQAGEPRITLPVVEQFVPQMVNFDVLGGVDFRKGCYPGQEVVARSQYRGTIKRRMSLAHVAADAAACPGAELFHSADPGQPCGQIVSAAPSPNGGHDFLAEIKLAALDSGSIHLGAPDGAAVTVLTLPYSIPTEV
ncbi:folate-binding protein YgfZ [Paraburkholderia bonniea]|uniref:CAF17-like 4Fe-4S cluster assembly/insertion protein YgfZ n=1 Tax=Paraburkholderia bonniea TaxID=2152891 RepID=UPI001291E56B